MDFITTTFDAPPKRHSRVCCCNVARVGRSTSMFIHRNKPPSEQESLHLSILSRKITLLCSSHDA